jgi:hypothetical protein
MESKVIWEKAFYYEQRATKAEAKVAQMEAEVKATTAAAEAARAEAEKNLKTVQEYSQKTNSKK